MRFRTLGRTGLKVSEISMGGVFIMSAISEFTQAQAAVRRALDLGINYIDTAPMYGNSEEVLGKALEGVSKNFLISTKVGYKPDPFNPQDKEALRRRFEESLRLLKRDSVDILMIHEPDRRKQFAWWTDWKTCDGPVMELMAELKKEGLIRFTGVAGTTAYEMAHLVRSGKFDVVLTAFNYSLLWREAAQEILPAAGKTGMGVVIGSPLQQGALAKRHDLSREDWMSKPRREQYQALYEYLDELRLPLPELGLRFVLSNPVVSTVLTGARSVAEVEQNVAAADRGKLPADVLKRLDEIAAMVPFRPFDEPFGLPFTRAYGGARGA